MKSLLKLTYNARNAENVLIGLTAVGMIVSMFAQLTAIKTNPNISKDKKKFLLNQEKVDGVTSTGLYCFVTSLIVKKTKKAFDKGSLLTAEIKDELTAFAKSSGNELTAVIKALTGGEPLKGLDVESVSGKLKNVKPLKNGMAMLATILGSVVAGNIITPIFRNKMSNNMQEKYKANERKVFEYQDKTLTPSIYNRQSTFSTISNIAKI